MAEAIKLGPAVLGKEEFLRQQREQALAGGSIGLGNATQRLFVANAPPPKRARLVEHAVDALMPLVMRPNPTAIAAAVQAEKDAAAREARQARTIAAAAAARGGKTQQPGKPSAPKPPLTKPMTKQQRDAQARAAKKAQAAAPPPAPSFSERDVDTALREDPNQWDAVLKAELQRPEGPRPIVATMILAVADQATAKPIPSDVLTQLLALQAMVPPSEV